MLCAYSTWPWLPYCALLFCFTGSISEQLSILYTVLFTQWFLFSLQVFARSDPHALPPLSFCVHSLGNLIYFLVSTVICICGSQTPPQNVTYIGTYFQQEPLYTVIPYHRHLWLKEPFLMPGYLRSATSVCFVIQSWHATIIHQVIHSRSLKITATKPEAGNSVSLIHHHI